VFVARHSLMETTLSNISQKPEVNSDLILSTINESLDDNKAEDILVIDLKGKTQIADYMVVACGRSNRQVSSIAEFMMEDLKKKLGVQAKPEGLEHGDWVLVDAGDVIVHVFRPEVREFYSLEKMWQAVPDRDNQKTTYESTAYKPDDLGEVETTELD